MQGSDSSLPVVMDTKNGGSNLVTLQSHMLQEQA
jgi:hypothetical protein